MLQTVNQILENCRVGGDYHTHVSMIQPIGKFQISKNGLNHFWDVWCTAVKNGETFGLAEKPQSYIPLLADIDIKVKFTEDKDLETLYTRNQILSVVRDYQDVIKNTIKDWAPHHLYCFVLEKPAYRVVTGDVEHIKNGIHLSFPYVFLSKQDHEAHIIPRVKKAVTKSNVFSSLGYDDSADTIDGCYVRNPWLMYGSKKDDNMKPYKLSFILDGERDVISLDIALNKYKIFDEDENLIDISSDYLFYLPRVLSIVPWHRDPCEIKSGLPSMIKLAPVKEKREYAALNLSDTLKKVKKLVEIISYTRAENYNDWLQIGFALYNISEGSEEGLSIWLEFSERCPEKYDEAKCISIWEKMEPRNVTMGTLIHFAKTDDPLAYTKCVDENSKENIRASLTGSHWDLAQWCLAKFGSEFVCSSIVGNIWYQYENHRWRQIEGGIFLKQKLSVDAVEMVNRYSKSIGDKISSCSNEGESSMYGIEQKNCAKLIANLKNSTFKSAVMKEMQEAFYNENFAKLLNKNSWLIGARNGVYDLKECVFRQGLPEDYLSKQMPIEYSEYDESDKYVTELYSFFEKVFPDKEIREYVLDIFADIFVGGNRRKKVYILSGCGDNAKSVFESMIEKMLGPDYAIKLPTTLITGKRTQSSAACPELSRAGNGVRFAVIQEPDSSDRMNNGLFKELSGNDTMYNRDLFSKGEDITLDFKLFIVCNKPPSIQGDRATWNRLCVVPFESVFSDEAPLTYEEQLCQKVFPKDPYFSEKIPSLIKPLLWMLLNRRKKGLKFIESGKVKLATESYRMRNDMFRNFMASRIRDEEKSSVNQTEVCQVFNEWMKEEYPGKPLPEKQEIKEYFTTLWGPVDNRNSWPGHKCLTFIDEIQTGEAFLIPK